MIDLLIQIFVFIFQIVLFLLEVLFFKQLLLKHLFLLLNEGLDNDRQNQIKQEKLADNNNGETIESA